MNSLFFASNLGQTDSENNDDAVGKKFVECVDVLEKIKALSHKKQQIGKVIHSYSVNQEKGRVKKIKSDHLDLQKNNKDGEGEAANSQVSSLILPLVSKRIENEIRKEKAFRLRRQNSASSRDPILMQQVEPFSMLNVKDPLSQTAERSIAMLKSTADLRQMKEIIHFQSGTNLHQMRNTVSGSFLRGPIKLPGIISSSANSGAHTVELNRGAKTQRERPPNHEKSESLHLDNIGEINIVDAVEQELSAGVKLGSFASVRSRRYSYGRHAGTASTSRFKIDKSVLFKVDDSNNINKSDMIRLTDAQLNERTYLKMGNLVTDDNRNLFETFMSKFKKISSMSKEFRVEGLQDYTEYPIEQFDVNLDMTRDIDYFLKQNNKGKSRWADVEGVIRWKPCTILNFNKETSQFLIQWENSDVLKKVTRMNLIFPGESPDDFEDRRVRANVIRCLYLLEKSLRVALLTPAMLEQCRIYISYDKFKKIMERAQMTSQLYNQSEELASLLQEVFDDYAIAILRFFVEYKTSEIYEEFVENCETNSKNKLRELKKYQLVFYEATSERLETVEQISEEIEIVNRWERPRETFEAQIAAEALQKPISIDKVFRLSLLRNTSTDILLDKIQMNQLLGINQGQRKSASKKVNLVKSTSILIPNSETKAGSVQTMNELTSPPSVEALSVPMILYRRIDAIEIAPDSNASKAVSEGLTKNIAALVSMLHNNLLHPADIYIGGMAVMKSILEEIEDINIFEHVERGMEGEVVSDLFTSQEQVLTKTFISIRSKIEAVQVEYE